MLCVRVGVERIGDSVQIWLACLPVVRTPLHRGVIVLNPLAYHEGSGSTIILIEAARRLGSIAIDDGCCAIAECRQQRRKWSLQLQDCGGVVGCLYVHVLWKQGGEWRCRLRIPDSIHRVGNIGGGHCPTAMEFDTTAKFERIRQPVWRNGPGFGEAGFQVY